MTRSSAQQSSGRNRATISAVLSLLLLVPSLSAESPDIGVIDWISDFRFYGDNTEFSGPYREGETILGGQLSTFFEVPVGDRITVLAGGFADLRSGDEDHPTDALPILSFRYGVERTKFILGTLETVRRHGLIDPLQVSTLELTRPVETGIQFLSGGERWSLDSFLNWQRLNTPDHREAFDYGLVTDVSLGAGFSLMAQVHGYHEGGQLYDAGEVYNNVVFAGGASWGRRLPLAGLTDVKALLMQSRSTESTIDPSRPTDGDAVWFRAGVRPWRGGEIWAILWTAEDFFAFEGDPNYGSVGSDEGAYVSERDYKELGVIHAFPIPGGMTFTAEARLHWIDDETPEVSFRVYARLPISFTVWTPAADRN